MLRPRRVMKATERLKTLTVNQPGFWTCVDMMTPIGYESAALCA
jgi:hypothetical protein